MSFSNSAFPFKSAAANTASAAGASTAAVAAPNAQPYGLQVIDALTAESIKLFDAQTSQQMSIDTIRTQIKNRYTDAAGAENFRVLCAETGQDFMTASQACSEQPGSDSSSAMPNRLFVYSTQEAQQSQFFDASSLMSKVDALELDFAGAPSSLATTTTPTEQIIQQRMQIVQKFYDQFDALYQQCRIIVSQIDTAHCAALKTAQMSLQHVVNETNAFWNSFLFKTKSHNSHLSMILDSKEETISQLKSTRMHPFLVFSSLPPARQQQIISVADLPQGQTLMQCLYMLENPEEQLPAVYDEVQKVLPAYLQRVAKFEQKYAAEFQAATAVAEPFDAKCNEIVAESKALLDKIATMVLRFEGLQRIVSSLSEAAPIVQQELLSNFDEKQLVPAITNASQELRQIVESIVRIKIDLQKRISLLFSAKQQDNVAVQTERAKRRLVALKSSCEEINIVRKYFLSDIKNYLNVIGKAFRLPMVYALLLLELRRRLDLQGSTLDKQAELRDHLEKLRKREYFVRSNFEDIIKSYRSIIDVSKDTARLLQEKPLRLDVVIVQNSAASSLELQSIPEYAALPPRSVLVQEARALLRKAEEAFRRTDPIEGSEQEHGWLSADRKMIALLSGEEDPLSSLEESTVLKQATEAAEAQATRIKELEAALAAATAAAAQSQEIQIVELRCAQDLHAQELEQIRSQHALELEKKEKEIAALNANCARLKESAASLEGQLQTKSHEYDDVCSQVVFFDSQLTEYKAKYGRALEEAKKYQITATEALAARSNAAATAAAVDTAMADKIRKYEDELTKLRAKDIESTAALSQLQTRLQREEKARLEVSAKYEELKRRSSDLEHKLEQSNGIVAQLSQQIILEQQNHALEMSKVRAQLEKTVQALRIAESAREATPRSVDDQQLQLQLYEQRDTLAAHCQVLERENAILQEQLIEAQARPSMQTEDLRRALRQSRDETAQALALVKEVISTLVDLCFDITSLSSKTDLADAFKESKETFKALMHNHVEQGQQSPLETMRGFFETLRDTKC